MNEKEYLKKYLHPEDDLDEALKRLEAGEPVQYIVGDVDFYGNILKVNKDVLIPRRETEELVEKFVAKCKKIYHRPFSVLDIGTGSGCIPISIKKLMPNTEVDAVDISLPALKVAKENAKSNHVKINFYQSNIFENVNKKYNCIISNPPYIKEDEKIMDIVKNYEPHLALYAPEKGLYFYRKILEEAKGYLTSQFLIAFEIGETQGKEIIEIAKKYFPDSNIVLEQDLQHLDRFIFIFNE